MKIEVYELEKDKDTVLFEMNEGYFRFETNLWSRFDHEGENNEEALSNEQKVLVKKLTALSNGEKPIFKKVLFYKNEIRVTLLYGWKKEIINQVMNMIKWSWPQFFITNP
ncbi:MAG: hypothetical protein AAB681_03225 [Patescibacteria group bacterium]